jgi:16S rRNA processing protein RimM
MKISVAYISRPRGFKGELAVVPYRPNTESLKPGLEVTFQKDDASRSFIIETVKVLRDRIALKLTGIDDEETAESWRGAELLLDEKLLAPLGEGEFYHFQLEGAEVYEESGKHLGKVCALEYLSANDILTVQGENGEILIPLIKQVVVSVDVENKKIVIRPLEGLY